MNRCLAAKRRARKLAAAVRDHLIHVHVELCAAPRHPNVKWKHISMFAGEDLVAGLNNQSMWLVVESTAGVVCVGGGLLQNGVRRNHLARDEVEAYVEMFK